MKNISIALISCLLLIFQISCKENEVDPPIDTPDTTLLAEEGYEPAWSPDGNEIAYIYDNSLYVMNSDGSNKRELATDIMEPPIWSPSGDYILYIGHSPSTLWVLVRIDVNGDNRTILCGGTTEPRLASWSPDGQKIVFITWNGFLSVINVDGNNLHTLTDSVHTPETPRWSPDMNKLLFTKGADSDRDMYLINSDGSNLIRLPIDSTYETQVQFSTDGTKVIFNGSNPIMDHIFSVNLDGSGFYNLTDNRNGSSYGPLLSPDGTKIAFRTNHDGDPALYIMNLDGSVQQRLIGADIMGGKSWSPDSKEIVFCINRNYKSAIYSIRIE